MAREREIKKRHHILCEGLDAFNYLIWILNQCKAENNIFDEFQVWDFGGITQLKTQILALQASPHYKQIQSIAIIRDAETNWQGAVQFVKDTLQRCGYAVPTGPAVPTKGDNGITTGFVLFPTCDANPTKGTLEDLCLQTLAKDTAPDTLGDVDKVLELEKYKGLLRPHKNRLHAYFSFTDDFVGLKIGEASNAHAFTITSSPVEALKEFLLRMTQ